MTQNAGKKSAIFPTLTGIYDWFSQRNEFPYLVELNFLPYFLLVLYPNGNLYQKVTL